MPARRALLLSLLGLVAVAALAYLRPLMLDDTFAVRDQLVQTIPSRAYLATRLHQGQLPEWWDGVRMGERFAGEPNNGVTYPPIWLVALGDPLWWTDLVSILHILLAGLGGLLLARRLGASPLAAFFSGASLMLSGYVTSMVVNGTIIFPVGWLPLVAWAALGIAQAEELRLLLRRALAFAAVLGGSVMAGNPAGFNAVVLAAALVAVVARRRWRALSTLAAAGMLGTLMGAVSLLPTLATLRDSTRGAGFALADGTAWSMHPLRLLELVWPDALGLGLRPALNLGEVLAHTGGALEAFWAGSLYVGVPVLACALLACLRGGSLSRRLGLLSLVFVVLALGSFTPAYAAYRWLVWPERLLRYPEKHFASALVLWAAMAGPGFDLLFRSQPRRRFVLAALPAILLACAAITLMLLHDRAAGAVLELAEETGHGLRAGDALDASIAGAWSAAAIAAALPLALLLLRSDRLGRFAAPLLLVLAVGQLVGHAWTVHITVPREPLRSPPRLLSSAPRPEPGSWPRVLWRANDRTPISISDEARALLRHHLGVQNDSARFGFGQLPGYLIAGTARFDALAAGSGRAPLERVMDLFDVPYLVLPEPDAAKMGMPMLGEPFAGNVLLENRERRPRAFVAYRWRSGVSDDAALRALFETPRPELDPGRIHLACAGREEAAAPDALTPCTVERPRPEHVVLRCRATRAGWAVLAEEWMQGWTATVDGRPAPLERADVVLRAVPLAAGEHVVEMRYRTPGLRPGFYLSLGGWLLFAMLLAATRRRDAVRPTAPG